MSLRKINTKNSFSYKKNLLNALYSLCLAMRSCCNCAISSKVYCVNNNFEKCIKCLRSNRDYDLTILFALIKQIYEKRLRLKKEVRKARIKLDCLKKQLNFLEDKEKEIIVTK